MYFAMKLRGRLLLAISAAALGTGCGKTSVKPVSYYTSVNAPPPSDNDPRAPPPLPCVPATDKKLGFYVGWDIAKVLDGPHQQPVQGEPGRFACVYNAKVNEPWLDFGHGRPLVLEDEPVRAALSSTEAWA